MSILLGKSKNKRANGETDLGSGPRDQTQTQKSHTIKVHKDRKSVTAHTGGTRLSA